LYNFNKDALKASLLSYNLLRNPSAKKEVFADLLKVKELLKD